MLAVQRMVHRLKATLGEAIVKSALTGASLEVHGLGIARKSPLLVNQTVLVTGASSGIGRAVALELAALGAKLVLVARSLEKLQEVQSAIVAQDGSAEIYAADLSSATSTARLLERLERDGVVVDVLINNAGRSIRRSLVEGCERAHDYERTMALNYFGALRLILGLLPGMRARRKGHVVNVSSAGVQLGAPLFSAYVASKAALEGFTRVAAAETARDQVYFTTVNMPLVRTPMIEPTAEYRDVPALSPEAAARLVLRSLVTRERQLGTRVALLCSLGYVLAPALLESALGLGSRL
jgi:short-subunit dehydrogenase